MKFEYDEKYDLLYIRFCEKEEVKVAKTLTITPGIHADLDKEGNLIGIEILDASKITGNKVEFTFPVMARASEQIYKEAL